MEPTIYNPTIEKMDSNDKECLQNTKNVCTTNLQLNAVLCKLVSLRLKISNCFQGFQRKAVK